MIFLLVELLSGLSAPKLASSYAVSAVTEGPFQSLSLTLSFPYIQALSSVLLPLFGQQATLAWHRKPFMASVPSPGVHSLARSSSHFSSLAQSWGWAENSKDHGQV